MEVTGIPVDESALAALCERWGIAELAVFGSAVRNELREDSDIDLLITWKPGVQRTLLEIVHLKDDFAELFGRPVDVAQKGLVEKDFNKYRRSAILDSARTLYAAA